MILELRQKLVADLSVLNVSVHETWPDRVTPPVLFVVPPVAGTYVTAGPDFQEYTVSVDVTILIRPIDLAQLDLLIEGVLANTVDWSLSGVDTPTVVTVNGIELFGTIIHLSKPTH